MNPPAGDTQKIAIHVDPDIAPLVPGFLENRRNDITLLVKAVSQKDFETARILGHSMKGSGGGYGFDGITQIGGEIEMAAKRQDAAAIRAHVDALSTYLAHVYVVNENGSAG